MSPDYFVVIVVEIFYFVALSKHLILNFTCKFIKLFWMEFHKWYWIK